MANTGPTALSCPIFLAAPPAASIDDLYQNAIDAVRLWIEDAEADGEPLPRPRTLEELRHEPEVAAALAQGAAFTLIPVLRDYGRLKKANTSIDTGLLEAIDSTAATHGLTRSSFLATAAREKIKLGGRRFASAVAARLLTTMVSSER